MRMLTLRPMTSRSSYPNSRSAAGLNASMRPCASMTTMPSTAESMTERHRASLARSSSSSRMRFGEVVQHARELALALDRHLADRQMERERGAVASTPGHLATDADDLGRARLEIPDEIAVVLVVVRRRHQHA